MGDLLSKLKGTKKVSFTTIIYSRNSEFVVEALMGRNRLVLVAILVALVGCNVGAESSQPIVVQAANGPSQYERLTRQRTRARIEASVSSGGAVRADSDAIQAARAGDFGLIATGNRSSSPAGVICFTPRSQAPDTAYVYSHGDVIDNEVRNRTSYAAAYNRRLVNAPDYPAPDLCRIRTAQDSYSYHDFGLITRPARVVNRPVSNLIEAARRGTVVDVNRLLKKEPVNAMDGLGMTALSWAVARNNRSAIDILLSAGANPWLGSRFAGRQDTAEGATYWAAALGRRTEFQRLARIPGKPFASWPAAYVTAATWSNDSTILGHMLDQPNDGIRFEWLGGPLPTSRQFELVLANQPELAEPLMFRAMETFDERPDLVRLALVKGANPNSVRSYESALAKASNGIATSSVEIVELLLKAGADPNLPSHRTRPVWEAVKALKRDREIDEFDGRAKAIFHKLVAAGADLNLPDWQARPPIWFLLFPYTYSHEELDANFVTPELLQMLVANGMQLNTVWNGKRVLPLVEAQSGKDSELSVTLRRLGAHR